LTYVEESALNKNTEINENMAQKIMACGDDTAGAKAKLDA